VTLVWLLIALRFVDPTQLVSRVNEARGSSQREVEIVRSARRARPAVPPRARPRPLISTSARLGEPKRDVELLLDHQDGHPVARSRSRNS